MTLLRKFSLINSKGEARDLMDPAHFFYEFSDIGIQRNDSYLKLGNRYQRINKSYGQRSVSGKILFAGTKPYDEFFDFASFMAHEPLKLKYTPQGDLEYEYVGQFSDLITADVHHFNWPAGKREDKSNREYLLDVNVKKFEKRELDKNGCLDCSIEFIALAPWYREVSTKIDKGRYVTEMVDTYKTPSKKLYPSDQLLPGVSGQVPVTEYRKPNNQMIVSDSELESPCKVTIYGPCKNPRWDHQDNHDGGFHSVQWGEMAKDFTLAANEKLVIDNTSDPFTINKYLKSGGSWGFSGDVYANSNFETLRFMTLRSGSHIFRMYEIGSGSDYSCEGLVEAKIYYETI